MAAGAIRESQRQSLRVPADVSIIGFDNKPLAAALNPPLTTVQISCEEMGRVATELLSMRLSGLSVSHALRVFIGSDLVVRSSTGPAPRG
jgi:DNA-binding LacI/PurR family transcriptional regulator